MKLLKTLKQIFSPNWEMIYSSNEVTAYGAYHSKLKITTYAVMYSEIRNKYKIVNSGFEPMDKYGCQAYKNCAEKIIELKNKKEQ